MPRRKLLLTYVPVWMWMARPEKKNLIWIHKSWLEDASPLKQEKDFDSWIHYERVFKLFNMLFLCLIKFHCKSIY